MVGLGVKSSSQHFRVRQISCLQQSIVEGSAGLPIGQNKGLNCQLQGRGQAISPDRKMSGVEQSLQQSWEVGCSPACYRIPARARAETLALHLFIQTGCMAAMGYIKESCPMLLVEPWVEKAKRGWPLRILCSLIKDRSPQTLE